MSRGLALICEGQGDVGALPVLVRRILHEKNAGEMLYVDSHPVRAHNPAGLVKWSKSTNPPDCSEWLRYLRVAANRRNLGGVLAVFDGDAKYFPAGSSTAFCERNAARTLAQLAIQEGATKVFSLAVVFAMCEFESWMIAGAESLLGKSYPDGRPILKPGVQLPTHGYEKRGKRWLETHSTHYRPSRDQRSLAERVDLAVIRSKKMRSFRRLENAIDQLLITCRTGEKFSTPL